MRVVILVPVLAPGRQLEGPKPPDVHAGIALFDMIEMRKAVHQTLHVQRVDQADRAHPEETHPAEAQNQTDANREDNDRRFCPSPDFVHTAGEFRSPALLVGGLSLIQPAKMRPPKTALLGAGDVLGRIGNGMMEAMVGDPACGMAGAVEDCPENQELLDEAVGLEGFVREHAVIADRGAQPAKGNAEQGHADNLKVWHGKKDQTDDCKNVNENEISEDAFLAMDGFPEGPVPRALLLRYGQFHILSAELLG